MRKSNPILQNFNQGLYFLFIALLFLALGSDSTSMIRIRAFVGLSLGVPLVLLLWKKEVKLQMNLPMLMLIFFGVYQCLRFLLHKWAILELDDQNLDLYRQGLIQWSIAIGVFYISFISFNRRVQIGKIAAVYVGMGFFLAMNAIPALYQFGRSFYPVSDYEEVFFYPFFYKIPFFEQYVFGKFAHPNYTGDVIALGFFTALAAMLYLFMHLSDQKQDPQASAEEGSRQKRITTLLLCLMITLVLAAAIFLLNSRGTITCFALCFMIYLTGFCVKFPSRKSVFFVIILFIGTVFFLAWRGNLQKAWFEVLTLQQEFESTSSGKATSYSSNIEGGRRALRIYQDHPVWGSGTGGYGRYAKNYGSSSDTPLGKKSRFSLADHQSMNHYLQKLAEEGLGALFYYLFLLFYFIEAVLRCLRTKSRFQFLFNS